MLESVLLALIEHSFLAISTILATFGVALVGAWKYNSNKIKKNSELEDEEKIKKEKEELKIFQDKISNLVAHLVIVTSEIYHIKDIEILKEQMKVVETNIKRISFMANDIMYGIIDPIVGDVKTTNYYTNFQNVNDNISVRVKDLMREYCVQNHFTDKTEIEFQKYIEDRQNDAYKVIVSMFKDRYPQQKTIMNTEDIKKLCPKINDCIRNILTECRQIAFKKEEDMRVLKEQLELEVYEKYNVECKIPLRGIKNI